MSDLRLLRWAIFSSFVFLTLPAYVQDHSECQDESFFLSNENLPYCEEEATPLPPPEPPCIYEEPLPLYDDTLPYCEEEAAPLPPPEPPCIYEEPLPLYDDTLPYCEEEIAPPPPPEPPCIYEEPLPLYDDTLPYCEEEAAPLPPPEPPCIYEEPEPFYEDDLPYCEETTSKPVKEERCECIEEKPIPPNKTLDAIIILGQDEELLGSQDLANASGVETCGFVLPTSSDILEQRLEPFFYKSLREKDILIDLKTELYKYFQDYNEPFVLVLIPGQTVQFTTKPQTPKPPPKEYYEWGRKELRQEACEEPAPAPTPKPQEEECAPEEPVFFEEVYECEEPAPAPAPKPQEECVPEEPVNIDPCYFEENRSKHTSFMVQNKKLSIADNETPADWEIEFGEAETICEDDDEGLDEEECECQKAEPPVTSKSEEECEPEEPVFVEEVYECEELEPASPPAAKKEQVEEICEEELEPAAPAKQMTVLQVKVIRAKLGEVFVSGAPERYKNDITTKHGEEIYPRNIQKDLNWINRQPFQRADVIYQAGQKSGETDLILSMDRRKPWRVYAGTDATGVQTIGRGRVFSGVDVAVPYGLISCQYSNSYDWTKYHTVTGQYTAFLPWRHVLSVYGGYSIVHASLPYPGSRNEGTSSQGSFRYTIPLPPKATLVHDFSFGGDFKNTNNTLQFSEFFPVYAQQVNLTQVALAYQGGWEQNRSRIDYQALINFSPGSWLPNMSNADYSSLRPGATHKWIYAKGDVRFVHKTVDGFGIHIRGQFQVTSQNLLPSEQLGIGGYDTVRGYDERQLNFDEGFIGSIEWRTPATPMMTRFREHKTKDSIQFLAFLDYGVGKNHNPIPGETNGEYLFGVGPGVRYTIDPWIACRLDWGFKLHRLPGFTGGSSEAHFSVIASY